MTLSVDGANLTEIANAIREKGGTNQPLEFPDGFAAALEDIETEITIQPKIEPRQVVLTTDVTAFPINAGFHDGTGTVSIDTVEGSASPTNQQVIYQPPTGKFFSRFWVDGIGDVTQIATGTITANGASELKIRDIGFQPVGLVLYLVVDPNVKQYIDQVGGLYDMPSVNPHSFGFSFTSGSSAPNVISGAVTFDYGSTETKVTIGASIRFTGTYFYMVFG